MTSLPTSIAAISDEWLTQQLHSSGALPAESSVTITDRTPVGDGAGWMCEVAQLTLDITGDPGTVPNSVVAKLPVDDEGVKAMLASARLYEREGMFFQQAAPLLDDRVPICWVAIVNTSDDQHLLVIEDLHSGTFGDQLAGCTAAEAAAAMRTMAKLHARFWNSPELAAMDWLPNINFEGNQIGGDLYRGSIDQFRTNFGHLLNPANELITSTLADHAIPMLDRLFEGPSTLVHFDFRLDNLYFEASAEPSVKMIDFQTVTRGNPGYDLGYFLTQSLDTDARRDNQDQLLQAYLDELQAQGVQDFSMDDVLRVYRWGALYAWITPVFVTSNLDMSNPRAVAMWTAVIQRSQAAQQDLQLEQLIT